MKQKRHSKILSIITEKDVKTQEQLTKELKDATKRIMGEITALWEEGHCEK